MDPGPVVDLLRLMVEATNGAATREHRAQLDSMYAVAVFLILMHHSVNEFSDTVASLFMPPWALASPGAAVRILSSRWRLLIMVACSALLNGKGVNHRKEIVIIEMYSALYSPIKPMAQWLTSVTTGYPLDRVHT